MRQFIWKLGAATNNVKICIHRYTHRWMEQSRCFPFYHFRTKTLEWFCMNPWTSISANDFSIFYHQYANLAFVFLREKCIFSFFLACLLKLAILDSSEINVCWYLGVAYFYAFLLYYRFYSAWAHSNYIELLISD